MEEVREKRKRGREQQEVFYSRLPALWALGDCGQVSLFEPGFLQKEVRHAGSLGAAGTPYLMRVLVSHC